MTEVPFHRDNHYVSRGYLKAWASSSERIWTYRVLVSHPQVPLWQERCLRGVAYHSYLYTRILGGVATDEFEQWLDREFEAPAAEAFRKVVSNERLRADDWRCLVRFLAAQDVRTPARLVENLQRWNETVPALLRDTLAESVKKLESARKSGQAIPSPKASDGNPFPFRLTTRKVDQELAELKAETVSGRGLWLFSMKHVLTHTVNALLNHHWTILSPPVDLPLFTSDDPVIRLNFHHPDKYDFGGGWGSIGTEILLPLSPRHLLYAQIGKRPQGRGDMLSREQTTWIRRFIAEHAHRLIFAANPEDEVPQLRPRIVDAQILSDEQDQWRRWHDEQTAAEREFMG